MKKALRAWVLRYRVRTMESCTVFSVSPCQEIRIYYRILKGDVPPDVEFGVAAAPWPA